MGGFRFGGINRRVPGHTTWPAFLLERGVPLEAPLFSLCPTNIWVKKRNVYPKASGEALELGLDSPCSAFFEGRVPIPLKLNQPKKDALFSHGHWATEFRIWGAVWLTLKTEEGTCTGTLRRHTWDDLGPCTSVGECGPSLVGMHVPIGMTAKIL